MTKQLKISMLIIILTAIGLNTRAQDNPRTKLSFGPEVGLPISDLGDRYDWSLGGSVHAEFPFQGNQWSLTLNAGFYNLFTPNQDNILSGTPYHEDLQVLPAKIGLKYFPVGGLFLQAEAGASFLLNKSDAGYSNDAAFTYSPQVGYRFKLGKESFLDAGFKWEGNTKFSDRGPSNHFLGIRLAYGFSL